MPIVRRKVFLMRSIKGMSYLEIASELSISAKTVENHISLAIKQIQFLLDLV
jgi:RNA polymerase sigma-70 factor (ECF subfamily)